MSRDGLKNKTCTIQRATTTRSDRAITDASSWPDIATDVKCSRYQLSAKEILQTQGWGIDADYLVTLPVGTTVRSHPPDRIVIDSTNYMVLRVDSAGRERDVYAWVKRQA